MKSIFNNKVSAVVFKAIKKYRFPILGLIIGLAIVYLFTPAKNNFSISPRLFTVNSNGSLYLPASSSSGTCSAGYCVYCDPNHEICDACQGNCPYTWPPRPGDFSLSLGGSVACNSVPLSWTASSGAQGYRILRGSPRVDISPYQPYTALNFIDTSVSQNTTYKYQIESYYTGGTNRSNEISVTTPVCPPTLSFSSDKTDIFQGQSITLTWATTYTTSCTASSAPTQSNWTGAKALNGSQTVVPLPPPSVTYSLQCLGSNGSTVSKSVTANITPLALPEFREIIPR